MSMFSAASAYERHVGRYGGELARAHAKAVGVAPGMRALDVGCGPGALAAVLADVLGASNVAAVDPSEPFVAACRERVPGVDARVGSAEELPRFDAPFDIVTSQLVLNFMSDAQDGVRSMAHATRPGGTVASCVWDYREGMTMLRAFWEAALELDDEAPDEGRTMAWCTPAELRELWETSGLRHVATAEILVGADYDDFDDYWEPFLAGVGPSGAYCVGLTEERRGELRAACHRHLGAPAGSFSLEARAWVVRGAA